MKKIAILIIVIIISIHSGLLAQETEPQTNISAKEIIDKYIEAIGGKDAIAEVEDRSTIMRGDIMGQNVTIIAKQKWPNKLKQEIKAGDMNQLTIFNGEKGFVKAAGQTFDVTGKELDALKFESNMDLLFDPEAFGITLSYEGEEIVDSISAHKIKMILPSGLRWFQYYDKQSGLKIRENKEMQTQMGLIETTTYYSDYKSVEGKLYPFKIKQFMGPQSFEMNVSSIKLNTGLDDSIFEIEEEPSPGENAETE